MKHHIRWKLVAWMMAIVLAAVILASNIYRALGDKLDHYVIMAEHPEFAQWAVGALFGILFFVLATVLLVFTSKGMVKRVLILSNAAKEITSGNFDVTVSEINRHDELYQLAVDFNTMAKTLRQNEYLRKDFISNVSHEIKTPLAVISGYADLLVESELPTAEQRECAQIIRRESRRLLNMSTNMVQMSRLDKMTIPRRDVQFRLDEQLRQVVLFLAAKWEEKNLELDIDAPSCEFLGDEEQLEQVWVNLLDNAIKFTPAGGRISVNLVADLQNVMVMVSDTGEGMTKEATARMFDEFYQAETSHSKEGCGLGLAIVKRIVALHSGSIEVTSEPGRGTDILVTLPQRLEEDKIPLRIRMRKIQNLMEKSRDDADDSN